MTDKNRPGADPNRKDGKADTKTADTKTADTKTADTKIADAQMADAQKADTKIYDIDISKISIEREMRTSYLDYAMSVIVGRALPDARDGCKPVHRRILYSMYENNYNATKPYRKSARVVGEVMGKYHPHGDQSIYDALARMAQDFSMRRTLIDGQGNFGSVDGDPPAAMRYTEVRLHPIADSLLDDIDKETVDFIPNYDGSEKEPEILPTRFPNFLINGSSGIAVGMSTNVPPHNPEEVIHACLMLLENPEASIEDLIRIIPGPDFPTAGEIVGRAGCHSAYHTGRGSVIMRAKTTVEKQKDRNTIIVSEIPYQVNKSAMIEKIAECVRDKKIEAISDIRDESDRHGMRIVIILKRDAVPEVVLNQLYKYTSMQTSFGCNIVALVDGTPRILNLKEVIEVFIRFRQRIIEKRTNYLLRKARERAHILVGLAITVVNVNEIVELIKTSHDPASARQKLLEKNWQAQDMVRWIKLIADPRHTLSKEGIYKLSENQARAILELRLQRLTALGREEVTSELDELAAKITDYIDILQNKKRIIEIMREEFTELLKKFSSPRKTHFIESDLDASDEDLIQKEDMVVTVSHRGYIKRVPLSTYRAQKRGGKGRAGMTTREEDFVTTLFVANTHDHLLFFSSAGMVYRLKVWKLPPGAPQARGKPMINLLPINQEEKITSILSISEQQDMQESFLVFATKMGIVKRHKLEDFERINRNGKIAIKLNQHDAIIKVALCHKEDDIQLTSANGLCVRFSVENIRVVSARNSMGVRGMRLQKGDAVISMSVLLHTQLESPPEAQAYLKMRRNMDALTDVEAEHKQTEEHTNKTKQKNEENTHISAQRYTELSAREQYILTVSENGYGKRSSSYEYRKTARGGKGIIAMTVSKRNGPIVASFPVEENDQIMLVTDAGQLIRCPVNDIRVIGRNSQGVIIFNTAKEEKVVAVEHISDDTGADTGAEENDVETE